MRLPLWRVAEIMGARGEFSPEIIAEGYSIDSRSIQPGELFFAVKGERLDGHDFVEAALSAGAAAAVVSERRSGEFSNRKKLILVNDTLTALQDLGRGVRVLWGKKLIGVTGSAGKTTAKEIVAHVLSRKFRVLKSQGNLNNHFGLPLQLLKLENEHEVAVIEMGMSHAGEIAALCNIARPEWGVVTNVNPVHLENFADGIAGIARAKYELIASLPPHGTAILNGDDPYVSQFGRDFAGKVITYGVRGLADVRAESLIERGLLGSQFEIVAGACREPVTLPLLGIHNVYNALAGAAAGLAMGILPSEVAAALAGMTPPDKRGQILELAGATIINDAYNSNPKALNSMVDALMGVRSKRHVVVAGEMLELGPDAEQLHRECGEGMAQRGVDLLIGVRGNARAMVEAAREHGIRAEFVETPEEAAELLAKQLKSGDAVLFKASRGVRLERALEALQGRLAKATY
ncbi:MAG TPA: UDP-N-acetylmuramoyl-tripeptide--D-alanyl-D-alanine ligase [Terriglobales bacterium]